MTFFVALAATSPTAPTISGSPVPGSSTSIKFTLVSPSTEPQTGIGSYNLLVSTAGSNGPWTLVANVSSSTFTVNQPYVWSGASPSTTYSCAAQGVDNSSQHSTSPLSNVSTLTTPASGNVGGAVPFPRTYVQSGIGQQLPETAANITGLAQYTFVQLGGPYNGAVGGSLYTRDQIVSGLKNQVLAGKNAVRPTVIQYDICDYANPNLVEWVARLNATTAGVAGGWYAYLTGTSGTKATSGDGALANICRVAGQDSGTGLYPGEWIAQYMRDRYFTGGGLATATNAAQFASANLDGLYLDSATPYLQGSGDFLRTGSTQGITNAAACSAYQQGWVDRANKQRALLPGKLCVQNTSYPYAKLVLGVNCSLFDGVFDYPMQQWTVGRGPFSQYLSAGWSGSWAWYKALIGSSANGSCVITGSFNTNDYALMRSSICMTLMDNGYFCAGLPQQTPGLTYTDFVQGNVPSTWPAIDEFWGGSLNLAGFLGSPAVSNLGLPQISAWQNGVYRRDFQNGIVLWNPTNASQTVALGGTFYHIRSVYGAQAINNGAQVSGNYIIGSGDDCGVILLNSSPP